MNTPNSSEVIPAKVLIVDDNEQNLELLSAYMEEIPGVQIVTAMDGMQAIAAVHREQPDLILLDVMMPRMSGFEVCRQIKNDPMTRDIPVIIITALNESSDYERGMESGANDFMTRPLNRADFLVRVRSVLRIKRLRNELGQDLG